MSRRMVVSRPECLTGDGVGPSRCTPQRRAALSGEVLDCWREVLLIFSCSLLCMNCAVCSGNPLDFSPVAAREALEEQGQSTNKPRAAWAADAPEASSACPEVSPSRLPVVNARVGAESYAVGDRSSPAKTGVEKLVGMGRENEYKLGGVSELKVGDGEMVQFHASGERENKEPGMSEQERLLFLNGSEDAELQRLSSAMRSDERKAKIGIYALSGVSGAGALYALGTRLFWKMRNRRGKPDITAAKFLAVIGLVAAFEALLFLEGMRRASRVTMKAVRKQYERRRAALQRALRTQK